MTLPEPDRAYLSERGLTHQITIEAGMICVVLRDFPLPAGYDRTASDLLVRLPSGYPDLPPDMWWFDPAIRLANGELAQATDVTETHLDRNWQRWSRHFTQGHWKPGVDNLESFLALVRRELTRCAALQ